MIAKLDSFSVVTAQMKHCANFSLGVDGGLGRAYVRLVGFDPWADRATTGVAA